MGTIPGSEVSDVGLQDVTLFLLQISQYLPSFDEFSVRADSLRQKTLHL